MWRHSGQEPGLLQQLRMQNFRSHQAVHSAGHDWLPFGKAPGCGVGIVHLPEPEDLFAVGGLALVGSVSWYHDDILCCLMFAVSVSKNIKQTIPEVWHYLKSTVQVCVSWPLSYIFWYLGDLADLAILAFVKPQTFRRVSIEITCLPARCSFKASLHHNRTHVRVQIRAVKIMRTISGCHKG